MNRIAIHRFWLFFELHADELARAENADDPVYDLLLAELKRVDPRLWFEFSTEARDVIIHAEGDPTVTPLVREIVATAPTDRGWTFQALRPEIGLSEWVEWDAVEIDTATLRFRAFESSSRHTLTLEFFVPGLDVEQVPEALRAIQVLLVKLLGEERLERSGASFVVRPLDAGATAADLQPAHRLEECFRAHARHRGWQY